MNAISPFPAVPSEFRFDWTDEAVERLRALAGEGKSASVIALEMGAPSRMMIIGKARRCGVSLRQTGANGGRTTARIGRPSVVALRPYVPPSRVGQGVRARSPRVEHYVEKAPAPVAAVGSIEIADLNQSLCPYPYGDPRDLETFRYCGQSIGEGARYCESHCSVMYQPRSKQKGA